MQNAYLTPLLEQAENVKSKIQSNFSSLNYNQLNWKPNPNSWSIGQCIDHLIVTNTQYFSIFEKINNGQYNSSIWERLPLLPNLFGKMILNSVMPETKRKQKTFPVFEPAQSEIPMDVLQHFSTTHDKIINYIKESDQLNHQKIVIGSPVAAYITYRLHHVCKIIVNHEERHYNQAKRVMELEGFPKG